MKSFRKYMSEGLDPVDKKALKGKHKDRKDKDLDNDGDVDSSDQYLHKRRKAISKAVTKEEVETVEEGENGLWANIKKKRDRIKKGSGEKMRKPGSEGAPTDQAFKDAAESVEEGTVTCPKCGGKGCEHCDGKGTHTEDQQIDEFVGKAIGGAVKMIAKGARNAVVNKQGNVRGTTAAKADSAEAKANKAEKKLKDAKRIKDAAARLADARKKAQENN
jgi:hypothetical protein